MARKPYARYAFANVYNAALLGAVGALAIVTGSWLPLAIGAGAEALWMAAAPRSKTLRRRWFDRLHVEREDEATRKRRVVRLAALSAADVAWLGRLEDRRQGILAAVARNPRLTQGLLSEELAKVERMVDSFIDLLAQRAEVERHLESVHIEDLEAELSHYQDVVRHERDAELKKTAQQNLDVLGKRQKKLAELTALAARTRAQLDLIENTFQLIGDQILTMAEPGALGGQLDELMDGVEAVRSAREVAAPRRRARQAETA